MIEQFYENAEGYIGEIGVVRLVTFRYFHGNLILLSRTSTSYISVLARYILLPSLPSLQGVSELKTAGIHGYHIISELLEREYKGRTIEIMLAIAEFYPKYRR